MYLQAVWFKDGEEILLVEPVVNIVCDENMRNIANIEVNNGYDWYSSADGDIDGEADDFVIRIKKERQ